MVMRGKQRKRMYIRLKEVCAETGWDRWYVRKLVAAGVLTEHKPLPEGRAWYSRAEVEVILQS